MYKYSTTQVVLYARMAQLVEHLLAKERVAGSSPVSRLLKVLSFKAFLSFCWKESAEFANKKFPMLDKNTPICQDELEKVHRISMLI